MYLYAQYAFLFYNGCLFFHSILKLYLHKEIRMQVIIHVFIDMYIANFKKQIVTPYSKTNNIFEKSTQITCIQYSIF
jgi:hypothetical protein